MNYGGRGARGEGRGRGRGDMNNQRNRNNDMAHNNRNTPLVCAFYTTSAGCRFGDACRNIHHGRGQRYVFRGGQISLKTDLRLALE